VSDAREPARAPRAEAASEGDALRIARADLARLAPLRRAPGVLVRVEGEGALVLVPPGARASLTALLARLPAQVRYERVAGGLLRRRGRRLPEGVVGQGFRPLAEALTLESDPAAIPPEAPPPVALRLTPATSGGAPLEADLLVTAAPAFRRWALSAPEVRLRPIAFALSEDPGGPGARALVVGRPLPPLAGDRYAFTGPLAVPLGAVLDPPLDAEAAAALLSLAPGEIALMDREGVATRIPQGALARCSRSAVRASFAAAESPQ